MGQVQPQTNAAPRPDAKLSFECRLCHRPITAQRGWVGREVRCPHCAAIQHVPNPDGQHAGALCGDAPSLSAKRYFNFVCKRCRSVLEAHTGMCGHHGHCPTCDAFFVIPAVDPRTGIPTGQADPGDDGQDPTPVHAYAAAGEQAPEIVRDEDGSAAIKCPRCNGLSSPDADNCRACGVPFSLEGASVARGWSTDAAGWVSAIAGLAALPLCFLFVPAILALVLGWLSRRDGPSGTWPPAAMAGTALGAISLMLGAGFWAWRLF